MKPFSKAIFLVVFLLSACGRGGADVRDQVTPTTPQLPVVEPPEPGEVEPTIEGNLTGYPALPTLPSGYLPPPTPIPTRDPYPGGMIIMLRPKGEQCAESPYYESVEEAIQELEEAGIPVHEAGEVELFVCDACGCPTSTHVRVQIDPGNRAQAEALGWRRE